MPFFNKPYKGGGIIKWSLQTPPPRQAQAKLKFIYCVNSFIKKLIICRKRAFCCTPFLYEGVMTVEAAVAFPLFLMGVMALVSFSFTMNIQQEIFRSLASAANALAVYGYSDDFSEDMIFPELLLQFNQKRNILNNVSGGNLGIDYRGTQYNKAEGKMNLLVSYHVDPMFNWFGLSPVCVRQGIVTRAWIGGEDHSEHSDPDSSEKEIVYVAENGVVYHRSRDCAYIDIELNVAAAYEISQIRNEQGAKYYPCELCGAASGTYNSVYITHTGNRYHSSTNCSGLKRTVYEMVLSEDCALPPCSKCKR